MFIDRLLLLANAIILAIQMSHLTRVRESKSCELFAKIFSRISHGCVNRNSSIFGVT